MKNEKDKIKDDTYIEVDKSESEILLNQICGDSKSFDDLVASLLDFKNDKFTQDQFNEWKQGLKVEASRPQDVFHKVISKEALRAMAIRVAAEIEIEKAISRGNIAFRRSSIAMDEYEENVHPAIEREVEIVREAKTGEITVLLLKPQDSKNEEARAKLFGLSKGLIQDATDEELESILDDKFPDTFGEVLEQLNGWDKFIKDLAELLIEQGRTRALEICSNKSAAEEVIKNGETKEPLLSLAKLALV